MKTITLNQYAEGKTHSEIAREIARYSGSCTREAVSQMLASDREIYVDVSPDGTILAWEKRLIPARRQISA